MRKNLKKLFSYYKPYMGIFIADMFFAFGAAAVSLVIPLVVRYITSEVVHWESSQALHTTGRDHAGTDRCSVLLQLFYIELRTCYGRKDRVRHACRDFFTLSETVLPFLR